MLAYELPLEVVSSGDGPQDFNEELRKFSFNGSPTQEEVRNGVTFFFNEFWTARQRQSHSLHEISYRACFKAQLPQFFIDRLTVPGDVVYDPFMGRGTTLIQAALMGREVIGNDINPLSPLLCRPRISPPTLKEISDRLRDISWVHPVADDDALLVFYHPSTLAQILALRSYLLKREASGCLDPVDDWIRMVALNRLTGHSSGFFSVYSLPPNQAVSVEAQRKINEKRGQTPPPRDVPAIILKKSRSLLKDGYPQTKVRSHFLVGPAEATPEIETSSVALVVTSPPFLDIVQYAQDNWLRCWFAGINSENIAIANHRKPDSWRAFVGEVFTELARVVRVGGHVAFEVGEVRNGTVLLEELVIQAIEGLPFITKGVLVNVQEFTKTANCWGITNNSRGTNTNRIVILERAHG